MSYSTGVTPRRLAQPHGSYFNAVLTPNLASRRQYNGKVKCKAPAVTGSAPPNRADRLNDNIKFVANSEVFDIRAGEPVVSSFNESGFSNHRRGYVFSSLNGYGVDSGNSTDLRKAFHESDIQFAGLCQNDYVASGNQSLREQGLAVQCSGIKTIINDSEETVHMGDLLMLDVPNEVPTKQRRGIPNEKVRFVLRPVPENYLVDQVKATLNKQSVSISDTKIAKVIAAYRKAAKHIVAKAVSSARAHEQVDVLLTKPSFV